MRFSSGGLPFVKALAIELTDRGLVQVSMNLTNYVQTPMRRGFEAVRVEAERRGVKVVESEIVGLVPQQALFETAAHDLPLMRFTPDQVLEVRLESAKSQIPNR